MNRSIFFFLAMVVTCIISFIAGCDYHRNTSTVSRIDTVKVIDSFITINYDSSIKYVPVHVPKLAAVIESKTVGIIEPNLLSILNSQFVYVDSIRNSEIAINILDTITQNKIIARALTYKILKPDSIITIKETITITHTDTASGLFVGTQVGAMGNNLFVAPSLLYVSKKKLSFSLGYKLINKAPMLGIFYQIK